MTLFYQNSTNRGAFSRSLQNIGVCAPAPPVPTSPTKKTFIILFLIILFSDNNECILGTHNCHANATCANTNGSFTCACNTGYSGNGVNCTGRNK